MTPSPRGSVRGSNPPVQIVVAHGIVTRVLRGLYADLPRQAALRLPVPQDRIFRLAEGRIEEIAADG